MESRRKRGFKRKGKFSGFSEIIPVSRRLYSRDLFLKRFSRADVSRLCELIIENRLRLGTWLPAFPEKLTPRMVSRDIQLQHREALLARDLALGIWEGNGKTLIGRITLHSVIWGVSLSAGLGYWLDKRWSGSGLMKQAVATMTSFCFEELGLHRVWASVQPENVCSIKLLEDLGFLLEGCRRQELFINGSWRDHLFYSILDEDYDRLADLWLKKGWLGS